uniref:Endoplasmic reticulum-Golgi intermediate compartment protein 3 n=1 Tax=Clastoptera arizonana TaxID=38151 RepID=A0A1B6DYG5_9HEMI
MMNFFKKLQPSFESLKQLDVYSKPLEDFRVKTISGGTASILCWCIIIFLVGKRSYEFFMNEDTIETIMVDTSRGQKLYINVDFIIPSISCDYLSLDAMDTAGEQHLHIEHNIYKRRLNLDGTPIEDPKREENIGSKGVKQIHDSQNSTNDIVEVKCGSCYGAENKEKNITCCNTCESVKEAYRLKNWNVQHLEDIEQCKSSDDVRKITLALQEGCHIFGYIKVNRVGGSFHIAPGQSFSINHVHVHDVQPFSSSSFNTSHIIRYLSFGKYKIVGKVNPLDGLESIATDGATMFQYYIKIIPTIRVFPHGNILHSYQFSVTKHEKVSKSGDSGMPGIFFSYELSALMVKITDKVVPWSHFINDCLSCIGGVFIVFMLIDSFFYRSSLAIILFKEKMDLGKAS